MAKALLAAAMLLLVLPARAYDERDLHLPEAPVRLWVIAPSAGGQWLMRIDNESDVPLTVAADVRLLRFEVRRYEEKRKRHATRPVVCDGPALFDVKARIPDGRELVLEPGQSYVEPFDPRIICFGDKAAALEPNAQVKAYYGFEPKVPASLRSRRAEKAPFVTDIVEPPRRYRPLKRLEAPSMLLSHARPQVFPDAMPKPPSAGEGEGKSPRGAASPGVEPPTAEQASVYQPLRRPPPKKADEGDGEPAKTERAKPEKRRDDLARAMTLTTDRYADAQTRGDIGFSVQAHNVGARPIWVALRERQLSFEVYGPDGRVHCPQVSSGHHIPRDLFRQLAPGKHIHMYVRLAEVCPPEAFARPGIYAVIPTLQADATGSEYGLRALTGRVTTRHPGEVGGTHEIHDDATLVRLRHGGDPFYRSAPKAVPTRPAPKKNEGEAAAGTEGG